MRPRVLLPSVLKEKNKLDRYSTRINSREGWLKNRTLISFRLEIHLAKAYRVEMKAVINMINTHEVARVKAMETQNIIQTAIIISIGGLKEMMNRKYLDALLTTNLRAKIKAIREEDLISINQENILATAREGGIKLSSEIKSQNLAGKRNQQLHIGKKKMIKRKITITGENHPFLIEVHYLGNEKIGGNRHIQGVPIHITVEMKRINILMKEAPLHLEDAKARILSTQAEEIKMAAGVIDIKMIQNTPGMEEEAAASIDMDQRTSQTADHYLIETTLLFLELQVLPGGEIMDLYMATIQDLSLSHVSMDSFQSRVKEAGAIIIHHLVLFRKLGMLFQEMVEALLPNHLVEVIVMLGRRNSGVVIQRMILENNNKKKRMQGANGIKCYLH